MSYNLFLDDIFSPKEIADVTKSEKNKGRYLNYKWKIAKSYDDFVNIVKTKGIPSMVSFDHDLCSEHWEFLYSDENFIKKDEAIIINYDIFKIKTGYHAAEWLMEYCSAKNYKIPSIILIHSQNAIGRKNLTNLLF